MIRKNSYTGEIIHSWNEDGHHFQIEKLIKPYRMGAGDRHYRLWDNGYPATGGQWHYSFENAVARAEYLLQGEMINKISFLEARVQELEGQLYKENLCQ